MDGGMSSHRKFALPVGLGLRALIQIMSGPDDLAGMVWTTSDFNQGLGLSARFYCAEVY